MRDIEAICADSFRDFHAKGLDYLCLHRSEEATIKAYFYDLDDCDDMAELVVPHNHRYAFYTHVLAGSVRNKQWQPRHKEDPRWHLEERFQEFEYRTPLNGGDGFTWKADVGLMPRGCSNAYTQGHVYFSRANAIHTLSDLRPGTVLLLTQLKDEVPIGEPTRAFRRGLGHEPPSMDGLYSQMDPDHALRRLAQLEHLGWRA